MPIACVLVRALAFCAGPLDYTVLFAFRRVGAEHVIVHLELLGASDLQSRHVETAFAASTAIPRQVRSSRTARYPIYLSNLSISVYLCLSLSISVYLCLSLPLFPSLSVTVLIGLYFIRRRGNGAKRSAMSFRRV